MELIVVSIGALAKNPLWNERQPVRTSHATTTLIRTTAVDDPETPINLLVDPSLPFQILEARIHERSGIKADEITHIFLTNWRPIHRRALEQFPKATWLMNPPEIDAANAALDAAENAAHNQGAPPDPLIAKERAVLAKVEPAPDAVAESVDLFPLIGYTPGQCGLLVSEHTRTTLIAGDAVPTAAHFSAGQVFQESWDLSKAKESLMEVYEVADIVIPGHDNLFLAPRGAGG
jgi:glyoxylase-like metal-dependent hydrolase (beta-lactamase superfamily II)